MIKPEGKFLIKLDQQFTYKEFKVMIIKMLSEHGEG